MSTNESAASAHVLVVEDERDIAALVAYHLTRDGYRVSTAVSGDEAIASATCPAGRPEPGAGGTGGVRGPYSRRVWSAPSLVSSAPSSPGGLDKTFMLKRFRAF